MESVGNNPLSKYFRQPVIYIKLPSDGRWWEAGSIDMPENRELPIYPMSARDEITLKTPDALMNGQGIVDVIQSCCPNIRDAWKCPSVDVDALLISIRIATYGSKMTFESTCTHCGERNTHELDLGDSLASINCPNYAQVMHYDDLKIRLRPQQYFTVNRANMATFEEQKIMSTLANQELDANTKSTMLQESMQKLIDLGIRACALSTEYIEMSDGTRVDNFDYIFEFYRNAELDVTKKLQETVNQLVEQGKMAPLDLSCFGCRENYPAELQFDYANFFAQGF